MNIVNEDTASRKGCNFSHCGAASHALMQPVLRLFSGVFPLIAVILTSLPSGASGGFVERMQLAHSWAVFSPHARAMGAISALPNWQEARTGVDKDRVYGTVVIFDTNAVLGSMTIGSTTWSNVGEMFRLAHTLANDAGYVGGFPTFLNSGPNYQVTLLRSTGWIRTDVSWRELRLPDDGGTPTDAAKYRAADSWCGRQGYFGGFVNGHAAVANGDRVFGVICGRSGSVRVVDVPSYQQNFLTNWNFATTNYKDWAAPYPTDAALRIKFFATLAQDAILLSECPWLDSSERVALKNVLAERLVAVHACTNSSVNGQAVVNGAIMCMNVAAVEFAQSLLHESMHMAGGDHDDRPDDAVGPYTCSIDGKSTNWPEYYSTSPLRAECCITGATYSSGVDRVVYDESSASFSLADPDAASGNQDSSAAVMQRPIITSAEVPVLPMVPDPGQMVPIDGGFTDWSTCSVTCGGGIQTRSCTNPPPGNGGDNCEGSTSRPCNTHECSDAESGLTGGSAPVIDDTTGADEVSIQQGAASTMQGINIFFLSLAGSLAIGLATVT